MKTWKNINGIVLEFYHMKILRTLLQVDSKYANFLYYLIELVYLVFDQYRFMYLHKEVIRRFPGPRRVHHDIHDSLKPHNSI